MNMDADPGTQESRADSPSGHACVEASVFPVCATTRQTALALVVALAAVTLVDTHLPDALSGQPVADYAQIRRDRGFGGVPVEEAAEAIDRRLPAQEPISIAPSISDNPLFLQRFSEGLYPRRITGKAAHQVTLAAAPAGVALAGSAKLLGPPAEPKLVPREHQSFSRSPVRALVLFVSLLGVGLVVLAGIRKLAGVGGYVAALTPGWLFPTAILVGALTVGLLWSLATWTHVSLPAAAIASAGLAGSLGVAVAAMVRLVRQGTFKTRTRDLARAALCVLRQPEVVLGLGFLVFAIYLIDRSPIFEWDARSIWFFHAKQLFFSGRMLPQDAKDYSWAHPGYPLLYPAVLSFFSSFGPWDERRAAVAISVLFAALSSLVFMLARRTLGRWPGAVFAFVPGLYLFDVIVTGYADSYVTLSLLIAALGFCNDDTEGFGWLGAFSAAMIKREGFVLAFVLCAAHTVISDPSRRRRWSHRDQAPGCRRCIRHGQAPHAGARVLEPTRHHLGRRPRPNLGTNARQDRTCWSLVELGLRTKLATQSRRCRGLAHRHGRARLHLQCLYDHPRRPELAPGYRPGASDLARLVPAGVGRGSAGFSQEPVNHRPAQFSGGSRELDPDPALRRGIRE